ncbi:MAG: heavy metal-binding domain-containing protein, partial [Lutibacter sp.]
MKTKILIAVMSIGLFTMSTVKSQEKAKMKQDTIKMVHSKMKMMDKSKEIEIKRELMEIDSMYTCPMHTDVKSAKPEKCPKCDMELKKMEMKMNNTYTCTMHSDEISGKPGECSKCG